MNADIQYTLNVCGAGLLAFIAWWGFCFLVREGIDGYRALDKFLRSNRKHKWRKIFIGGWR